MKHHICITALTRRDFAFEIKPDDAAEPTRIRVEMPLPLVVCGAALALAPQAFARWLLPGTKLYVNDEMLDLLAIAGALPLLKSMFGILKDGKKKLGRNAVKAGAKFTFQKVIGAGSAVGSLLNRLRGKK